MNKPRYTQNSITMLPKMSTPISVNLPVCFTVVKQFPYRTARVTSRIWSGDGHRNEAAILVIDSLHKQIADALGVHYDNHEAYEVQTVDVFGNTATLYFGFSDFSMCVGTAILEGGW